jgi:hypothetical protein
MQSTSRRDFSFVFIHVFRVNLVCLDIQETQVSKGRWERLVFLDYQETLEQKVNRACLDSQVGVPFPFPFFSPLISIGSNLLFGRLASCTG